MEICVNKMITDVETGTQCLVLWVAPGNEYGYWYDLNSRSRKPIRFEMRAVVEGENHNLYEVSPYSTPTLGTADDTFTEKERIHRDRVWNMIQSAVENEPDIYDGRKRSSILKKVAEENDIKPNNLYALLDRYWRSGKTKNAFIPDFAKRGGKGKSRKTGEKKIGRPSLNTGTMGKVITDSDRKNFAAAIKKYYLSQKKISLKATYERLLQDFYTVQSEENPEKLKLLAPQEVPSFRQFQYWHSKSRDVVNEQKKRSGERAFELNSRRVLGKSDFGLMGPGAQFQIDATVGDVYLVSQFDRSNLIGRPVIYFVIDAFSRMVTGMSVGLEGPSWAGAMMAIANMAADKVTYCKQYDIEIKESEWPCHHIPSALLGDRGEMESKNADNLVNMLGIRIVNAPPYRADLKGIIEQHFHTINTNSVALLPGSVKPDMSKRGGHDYRLDAALDIRQFTQIIIKCVLYYNNHHYMEYFEKSEAMMRDQVKAIPIQLWHWGIRHCSGALRSYPEELVRLAVMPTAKATVTGKGIRFKGVFYSSDRAIRESWFEKARSGKSWQVSISYDPRDMTNVYIWNQGDKSYDVCSLLDWNGKNAGKCLDEIVYEQRKEKLLSQQLKVSETEAKVNLNAEIDSIVSQAKNMGKGLPSKSKKERISQIKENRRQERESMRMTESSVMMDTGNPAEDPQDHHQAAAEEEMSPTLRMIKRKLEERLRDE
ncbi:Mu transposase C-terminal domain-containing protein [Desulfosporosinus lacus]|uniref:Mu transposase, C-terminal n=1 Tax=Desulfosporosinus lacus DSM 15449 TaxID=1121420 RepID=A0A1M5UZB0_9FIRM|nr:Mu transposase C-terminal domain-containing protein [Desulfosporosinus lacus]SHH68260.1 Mu transposase, C-terminal [Desulfosporosinus lacus DSM 15449]